MSIYAVSKVPSNASPTTKPSRPDKEFEVHPEAPSSKLSMKGKDEIEALHSRNSNRRKGSMLSNLSV